MGLTEQVENLYHACGCADLVTLADNTDPEAESVITQMLEAIYKGALVAGQIDAGYYNYVAKKLSQSVAEGLNGTTFGADDYRNTLKAYLDQNIYAFSGAKSLAALQEYRALLTDEKNELRSFEQFKKAVAEKHEIKSIPHLEAEQKNAVANAQMAEKWESLKNFGTLEIRTAGDHRVRPEHAALDGLIIKKGDTILSTLWPPFDFGCRCNVVPGASTDAPTEQAQLLAKVKAANIKPYFKNNAGLDKVVFADGHPYFKAVPKELDAVKNYNLKSVATIYDMEDLPVYTPLPDKEAAYTWWRNIAGENRAAFNLKSVDGIEINFSNQFRNHVLEENQDKRHRFLPQLMEVVKNPDEVWANRERGKLQTTYIKYYQNYPIILGVEETRAVTLYEVQKGGKLNEKALNNMRRGILKYKK